MRVRTAYLGGGFGAKLYIKLEALVAVCALLVRKPVRIALSMDEQFYTITKHGATVRIKTGVKHDGRMIAREVETFWNGGAYADIGPRVTQKSGFTAAGPYDIEHVSLDNYAVYTNEPPAGALRGFGISQLVWAYERQADIIARTLGIDPLEFRRRNALRPGRPHATGTVVTGMETTAVLDRLSDLMQWDQPFDRGTGTIRRGRGIAMGVKACVAPTTSTASVLIYGDGSCAVHCGTASVLKRAPSGSFTWMCSSRGGLADGSSASKYSSKKTRPVGAPGSCVVKTSRYSTRAFAAAAEPVPTSPAAAAAVAVSAIPLPLRIGLPPQHVA